MPFQETDKVHPFLKQNELSHLKKKTDLFNFFYFSVFPDALISGPWVQLQLACK